MFKLKSSTSKQRSSAQRIIAGSLLTIFLSTLSLGYLGFKVTEKTSAVGAGVPNQTLSAIELLEQFPRTCGTSNFDRGDNGAKGFAKKIKGTDYNDNYIAGKSNGFWGYFGDQYLSVGYNIENEVNKKNADKGGKKDGIVSCREAFHFIVVTATSMGRKEWLGKFYDVTVDLDSNQEWNNIWDDKVAEEVFRRLTSWADTQRAQPGYKESEDFYDTKNILDAFNKCWKYIGPTGDTEETSRENRNNWERLLDGGDDALVAAGYRVEVTVEGSYRDGNANCNDTWDWAKENDKLGKNPLANDEKAIKIAAIIALLNQDPTKAMKCIKLITTLASLDTQSAIEAFTRILVNGVAQADLDAEPEIAAQITAAKECILSEEDGFGAELADLINEPVAPNPNNEEGGSGSAGQSDDCLSKSDQFLAWFACPVINLIDSVMEKLEDVIKSLLAFNLEDQNEGDGLRNAWNIFRSLATILIMAGFLLALLVKAIKGE